MPCHCQHCQKHQTDLQTQQGMCVKIADSVISIHEGLLPF